MDQEIRRYFAKLLKEQRRQLAADNARTADRQEKRLSKVIKRSIRHERKYYQRAVGVYSERTEADFKALREQYGSIQQKQFDHDRRFDEIDKTQVEHTKVLLANQKTLVEHDEKLDKQSEKASINPYPEHNRRTMM